jgi:hypothetical protein
MLREDVTITARQTDISREDNKDEWLEKQKKEDRRLEYNDVHHLNEVLKEILAYNKTDGYEKFEEVSMYIKRKMTKLSFQYYLPRHQPQKSIELTPLEEKVFKELNKKKPKQIETVNNYIEDVLSLSRVLEWAGISFNKNEWFKIRLAMKKLLLNAVSLRFWGKIYGIDSDYYIIQGSLKNYSQGNPKPYIESRGNEGLNRYTFWVSNSLLEGWTELPEVTAEQMSESRKFKYHFTGDLSAKVRGFNNFSGKETHLLKCQILRIMHSSSIVPDGFLRISDKYQEELAGKITEFADGEYTVAGFEDMKTEDRWAHEYAYIYPNGKVVVDTSTLPENVPAVDRLRKIAEDEGFKRKDKDENEEIVKYWKIKVIGDQMQYQKEGNNVTYATILINNTRWPGSSTVWKVIIFIFIFITQFQS